MRRQRGFTLLELMTAVAIVAVITTLSVVGYSAMVRNSKETSAIRELYSQAIQARQQARARGQSVRFSVRQATLNNATQQVVRWGRLPCEAGDTWGNNCPSTTCKTNACADTLAGASSSCTCEELGTAVVAPATLDLSGFNGLCFVGRSGLARGMACDPATAAVTSVRVSSDAGVNPFILGIDQMTGSVTLKDCGAVGNTAADGGCY